MFVLSGIIILGILAQWVSWRTKVPAIMPLIIIGLLVGPISTLFTPDGCKLIQPRPENDCGGYLFSGQYLFYFTSLAIGIILFEGGLTLKRGEIRGVGPAIIKLITVGSLVTFIGGGLAAHYVMGLDWKLSFLFGGLIIVTGPTVIAPILRNVPLTRNVSTVLKWEGILIDPIGALVAVLVFEFIISGEGGNSFTHLALVTFGKIILISFVLGALAAWGLAQLIKRELIPNYLLNVFTLALVLAVFVLSDVFAHESGLLTVVVMGMVLGNLDLPKMKDVLDFKESLSILLISVLFILLSANIDLENLLLLLDWRCLTLFGLVIFVLRPLGVFLSTGSAGLNVREKLFISWVGPRGIVAAGVASLFGIKLIGVVPGAEYITPLVFLIVLGTVLLNATTARPLAKLLGITMESSNGILIIGANSPARLIAAYLQENQRHVVLVDTNSSNVKKAKKAGLEAFEANIYTEDLEDHFELLDMGYLMAMTSSSEVNEYAAKKYEKNFGELGTFRLISPEEMRMDPDELPSVSLFSSTDDYLNISEAVRDYPEVHEVALKSKDHFMSLMGSLNQRLRSVPIFIKESDGNLEIIPASYHELEIKDGDELVYIGKQLETQEEE